MKIVPVNEVIGNESYKDEKRKWERHVPEDYFEQQLFSSAIAHNVWETVSGGRGYLIPIQLKDARDGCIAELSIPYPPNWDLPETPTFENWDSQGRLQATISVYHKEDTFDNVQDFPIFYSIMSSLDYESTRNVNIVFEFAATPFSQADQTNFDHNNPLLGLLPIQNPLPILEVPPGHEFYEAKVYQQSQTVYVPALDKDDDLEDVNDISNYFDDKESYENWVDSSD